MNADTVRLWFSYTIAFVVIVGGGIMLMQVRLDPPESGSATLSLAIVGFIATALTFVFTRESATQAQRAAERTFAAAQQQAAPPEDEPASLDVAEGA